MAVLKLLRNMGKIRFTCCDVVATVEETKMDPDPFATLYTIWVKATGIPKVAKKKRTICDRVSLFSGRSRGGPSGISELVRTLGKSLM